METFSRPACVLSLLLSLATALPVFAQDDLASRLATERAFAAEEAQWTEQDKEAQRKRGARMLARLKEAAESGQKTLDFRADNYRLATTEGKAFIELRDAEDLTVNFHGATIWFEQQKGLLRIMNCRSLTLKNVSLDMDPLPFFQGEVVAMNPGKKTIDVAVAEAFDPLPPLFLQGKGTRRGAIFTRDTREFKRNQGGFQVSGIDRISEHVYRLRLRPFYRRDLSGVGVETGDLMAFWARRGRAIRIIGGRSVTLENLNLYAGGFIGINEIDGAGPNTYRNVRIVRRPGTTRLIACNADMFNSSCMENGPRLLNCAMEYSGDDFINIHSFMGKVYTQPAPDRLCVDPVARRRDFLREGTLLHFYKYTRDRDYLGKRRVVSVEYKTIEVGEEETLFDKKPQWRLLYGKNSSTHGRIRVHDIILDKPIEIDSATIYMSDSHSGKDAVIRGNVLQHNLARGMRIQAPYATIEDNTVRKTHGYGISLVGMVSYWGEGTIPHHCVVRNNLLEDTWLGAGGGDEYAGAIYIATPGNPSVTRVHAGTQILHNKIDGNGGPGIVVRGGRDLVIRGNTVRRHGLRGENEHPAMILDDVENVQRSGNTVVEPGDSGTPEIRQSGIDNM